MSSRSLIEISPQDVGYLASNELFVGLDPDELAIVAREGRVRQLRADTYLFRQGDRATNLYILLAGRVKMTQLTPEGHQVMLRIASPGESLGVVAALDDTRYPATAQAADSCRLLTWDGEVMLSLMHRVPQLAINALRIMSKRVQEFQDRYRELATERAERRVARALLRLAQQVGRKVENGILIDLTFTRQDLAEMTGTTRYTISRMLSEWEARGLIEASRERVLIKRPHDLVAIAEDLPPITHNS